MTDAPTPTSVPDLDGGPYDIEYFFDPGCPFAWMTSVWIRRVVDLRDIKVGWRFISLLHINDGKSLPDGMRQSQLRTHRYLRLCAAARAELGNDAVGRLYRAFGERFWYTPSDLDYAGRLAEAAQRVDPVKIVVDLGLPAGLIDALDDESYDAVIVAESDEAFRRTGPDVGTPIISYDPPNGSSLFGPVISSVPERDEDVVALFDALRTFTSFPGFSELKRTARPPLDLPLFG